MTAARFGMRRTPPMLAGVALAALLLSACGTSGTGRPGSDLNGTLPPVMPKGAQAVQVSASSSATDNTCNGGHPTASLAPLGPLPIPGQMPAGSYMATIAARGYLVAGVDQNTLLWGYRDPKTGDLTGFDIDMVSQISDAIFGDSTPAHLHLVVVPNANRISAVESGAVDVVAETMTITCPREQSVDFSTEYYDAGQELLVPKNSGIASERDLAGKRVCASQGSTSLTNLANLNQTLGLEPSLQLWEVPNQTDCLVMLQQGQVDAISTDDTILEGLAAQDPQTELVTGVRISDEPYGMAISKQNPDFTRFVNAVLAQERANGTWAAIWNHWLSAPLHRSAPTPPAALYRD